MSVMLLPHTHINVLAHEATKWGTHIKGRVNPLAGAVLSQGVDMRQAEPATLAQAVGLVLTQALAQSYTNRYDLTGDEAKDVQEYINTYRYTRPRKEYTTAELAHANRSFEYQGCEAPDWEDSAGYTFYALMQEHLLERIIKEENPDTWVIRGS